MEIPTKYNLDQDDKNYLELWKFFAERGDAYKDKMWTITIWLYALLGGILGYMMSNFMGGGLNKENESVNDVWMIAEPGLSIIFSIFAILFCIYIVITIKEYGEHVQHNWNRANYLLVRIDPLPDIWYSGLSEEEKQKRMAEQNKSLEDGKGIKALSTIPRRLIYVTYGFMLLFLAIIVCSVIETIL